MTPKENYMRMLRGEIPDYIPSMYEDRAGRFNEELLTPQAAPNGPIVTSLGVTYVGNAENNFGAMPAPGKNQLGEDIRHWRDVIHVRDLSDFDWEGYYKKKMEGIDRTTKYVSVGGGDYFLTLVSFMGFENLLLNMYEEPDIIKEMLEFVSDFYLMVLKKQFYYCKPDGLSIMDDDSAERSPFFSVEMYQEFFKPFHKRHTDLAHENDMPIERHDCGRCEPFIPDWVELGINAWNPAQTVNDLKGIKARYGSKLAICGGWDALKYGPDTDEEQLRADLKEYVDTFAPGGGFSFMARVPGDQKDPRVQHLNDVVKEFYFSYAHDWYKTH